MRTIGLAEIVPTQGAYQNSRMAFIERETNNFYFVRPVDGYPMKFSKKDMLQTGHKKEEFPRYKLNVKT